MTKSMIVSSQSGALGRGTGGPSWASITSLVKVWDNINPLGANGTQFLSAAAARTAGVFEFTDRDNAAVWFAHRLAKHLNEQVDMVLVGRGGTTISNWAPVGATYPMLQEMIDVWAATGKGPADIFVWHGNESNATNLATYGSAFANLVTNLTAANVISATTKIIIVGTPEDDVDRILFNSQVLRDEIAALDPRAAYARSDGLKTFDNLHFDGPDLYQLGVHRIFDAYKRLERLPNNLWAWVNKGGTPGVADSGVNSLLDLSAYAHYSGFGSSKGGPKKITVNCTYKTPTDVGALLVYVQGGGGGGAGALGTDGVARIGGGGGAGAGFWVFIENPEAQYDIVIGPGGAGGAAGQNNGATGTATSFGELVANGGGAGSTFASSAVAIIAGGGAGATARYGDIRIPGSAGSKGIKLSADVRVGGDGAPAYFGGAGRALQGSSTSATANGEAAAGEGAGGGGGVSSTTVSASGGAGGNGAVLIWEFIKG